MASGSGVTPSTDSASWAGARASVCLYRNREHRPASYSGEIKREEGGPAAGGACRKWWVRSQHRQLPLGPQPLGLGQGRGPQTADSQKVQIVNMKVCKQEGRGEDNL